MGLRTRLLGYSAVPIAGQVARYILVGAANTLLTSKQRPEYIVEELVNMNKDQARGMRGNPDLHGPRSSHI
jgi:hypothetical protein